MTTSLPVLERTCSSCAHWHRHPVTAQTLGQQPLGECREQPRLLPVPNQHGMGAMAVYLVTQASFPACGRFTAAVVQ